MALLNNLKDDLKGILSRENLLVKEAAEKVGTSASQFSQFATREQHIRPGFITYYEKLGYDIRIEYIRRAQRKVIVADNVDGMPPITDVYQDIDSAITAATRAWSYLSPQAKSKRTAFYVGKADVDENGIPNMETAEVVKAFK